MLHYKGICKYENNVVFKYFITVHELRSSPTDKSLSDWAYVVKISNRYICIPGITNKYQHYYGSIDEDKNK